MSICYIPECTMVSSRVISKRSEMLKYKQQHFALYFNYNLNKRLQQYEMYISVIKQEKLILFFNRMHTY